MSHPGYNDGRPDLQPETLEVPDNVRREIERLQNENRYLRDVALPREIALVERAEESRKRWKQRAERAEAELEKARQLLAMPMNQDKVAITHERQARERAEARLETERGVRQQALERAEAALRELVEAANAIHGVITENYAPAPEARIYWDHHHTELSDLESALDKARAIVEGK